MNSKRRKDCYTFKNYAMTTTNKSENIYSSEYLCSLNTTNTYDVLNNTNLINDEKLENSSSIIDFKASTVGLIDESNNNQLYVLKNKNKSKVPKINKNEYELNKENKSQLNEFNINTHKLNLFEIDSKQTNENQLQIYTKLADKENQNNHNYIHDKISLKKNKSKNNKNDEKKNIPISFGKKEGFDIKTDKIKTETCCQMSTNNCIIF